MTNKEAYLQLHKACGIEVGDTVKVVRVPFFGAEITPLYAAPSNRAAYRSRVGAEVTIVGLAPDGRFLVDKGPQYVPFYCLELLSKGKPEIKVNGDTVKFEDGKIKVGRTTVPHDIIDEIHERIHKATGQEE